MLSIEQTITEFARDVPFATVGPDDPVSTAMRQMLEQKLDCVLVTEAGKLIGIFTEHDFLHRVAAAKRDPATTPMREVMTAEPNFLRPNDRMHYVINRMAVRGIRNIPVVDPDGHPTTVLDVRIVMLHLLKVFAQAEREGGQHKQADEWTDIGGAG